MIDEFSRRNQAKIGHFMNRILEYKSKMRQIIFLLGFF